ncbi:VanZ family protein [Metabacillus malikii]|uniref:Glycopeptide antibiotics resistance protein n=1 Tax=Metabacillus malikii TaxID=1504265 RepID=A0ABT9ZCT1_9BACI|nr:VanZ family protein [Metabacillus malikii]MDQ0230054.1 glycopeptide antibiotics resistance protein [Metabacillus malikii]
MNKQRLYPLLISQVIFFLSMPFWLKFLDYLHPIVIGVIWILLTSIAFILNAIIRKDKIFLPIWFVHLIIVLYTISLFVLLFFRPETQTYGTMNLIPFDTINYYFSGDSNRFIAFYNIVANICLFIPFGIYYHYVVSKPHWMWLMIVSVYAISLIELTQFLTRRGSLDVDDLILNVLGVWLGYLIAPISYKILIINRRR